MHPKEKVNRHLNQLCLVVKDSVQKDLFNARNMLGVGDDQLRSILRVVNASVDAASMTALPRISESIMESTGQASKQQIPKKK